MLFHRPGSLPQPVASRFAAAALAERLGISEPMPVARAPSHRIEMSAMDLSTPSGGCRAGGAEDVPSPPNGVVAPAHAASRVAADIPVDGRNTLMAFAMAQRMQAEGMSEVTARQRRTQLINFGQALLQQHPPLSLAQFMALSVSANPAERADAEARKVAIEQNWNASQVSRANAALKTLGKMPPEQRMFSLEQARSAKMLANPMRTLLSQADRQLLEQVEKRATDVKRVTSDKQMLLMRFSVALMAQGYAGLAHWLEMHNNVESRAQAKVLFETFRNDDTEVTLAQSHGLDVAIKQLQACSSSSVPSLQQVPLARTGVASGEAGLPRVCVADVGRQPGAPAAEAGRARQIRSTERNDLVEEINTFMRLINEMKNGITLAEITARPETPSTFAACFDRNGALKSAGSSPVALHKRLEILRRTDPNLVQEFLDLQASCNPATRGSTQMPSASEFAAVLRFFRAQPGALAFGAAQQRFRLSAERLLQWMASAGVSEQEVRLGVIPGPLELWQRMRPAGSQPPLAGVRADSPDDLDSFAASLQELLNSPAPLHGETQATSRKRVAETVPTGEPSSSRAHLSAGQEARLPSVEHLPRTERPGRQPADFLGQSSERISPEPDFIGGLPDPGPPTLEDLAFLDQPHLMGQDPDPVDLDNLLRPADSPPGPNR